MTPPLLEVSSLSKKYARQLRRALAYAVRDIGGELWSRAQREPRLRPGEFWALDDVSFDLRPGEGLAVLGSNGAGKSTLLRILYGLLKPDGGEVRLRGRAEALIELGTGFNPLLTGRENLEVVAALHRVRGRDARLLLDEVVAFSELEDHIDAPIQSYSAGMRARLGYSIMTHLRPDVLLVDEVLAVGDFTFQRKCMQNMRSFLREGGALMLVTHNIYQAQAICDRGLVLDRGRAVFDGTIVEAVSRYFGLRGADTGLAGVHRAPPIGPVTITGIRITSVGSPEARVRSRGPARIAISYRADQPLDVIFGFGIAGPDEAVMITGGYDIAGRRIEAGEGEISCVVRDLPLLPGRHVLRASITDRETMWALALFGFQDSGQPFEVEGDADLFVNSGLGQGQLVAVDADWD
jgi:ABC-type polysaccharide/polyol phosphate transport system ATPase subunit